MPKPLHILIVDDDESDLLLLLRTLKKGGYEPVYQRVDNARDMNLALDQKHWEIVTSDHRMPSFSEVEVLEILRQRGLDIPCIVISGTIGEELAVAAMKLGASDYIMKDNLTRLVPAVERELREAEERRARRRAEEQFRGAQKMESIGRLAGGIAHDFNNLLTAILGYCEFLRMSHEPSDPRQGDIAEIKKASDLAANLTRQLLTFSRRQVLQMKVLNINDTVRQTAKMLKRMIGEDIELIVPLDPDLPPIKADAGQIEQVLLNLAVNARDAMPKGGRLIIKTTDFRLETTLPASPYIEPGRYALLTITDTGCGMSRETRAHLFEPFFTTKTKDKGTGLGLSTVYGIIKQSNAYIDVASEPDKGTTFNIYLPATTEPLSIETTPAPNGKQPSNTETILLVEDEEMVRNMAHRFLESNGYRVVTATSAEEATLLFDRHKDQIDLLFTDVILPGLSGPDLAESLRARKPHLKVLYCSGYAENVAMTKALAGAFIPKPFLMNDLLHKVRAVLDTPSWR